VNFSGTAADSGGSGFKDIRVAIRNTDSRDWYNFENDSFDGAEGNGSTIADLSNTQIDTTHWNYSLTLPAGNFSLHINVRDNAGNIAGYQTISFSVISQ